MNTENISTLITTSIWKIQLPSSSFISRSICDGWTGFVLIYRLCSRVARNLTFRGVFLIFLLTPITLSKKCSESKSGFSRKGMSAGSMLTILSRARLNRTRSAARLPKRNQRLRNSFRRYGYNMYSWGSRAEKD